MGKRVEQKILRKGEEGDLQGFNLIEKTEEAKKKQIGSPRKEILNLKFEQN